MKNDAIKILTMGIIVFVITGCGGAKPIVYDKANNIPAVQFPLDHSGLTQKEFSVLTKYSIFPSRTLYQVSTVKCKRTTLVYKMDGDTVKRESVVAKCTEPDYIKKEVLRSDKATVDNFNASKAEYLKRKAIFEPMIADLNKTIDTFSYSLKTDLLPESKKVEIVKNVGRPQFKTHNVYTALGLYKDNANIYNDGWVDIVVNSQSDFIVQTALLNTQGGWFYDDGDLRIKIKEQYLKARYDKFPAHWQVEVTDMQYRVAPEVFSHKNKDIGFVYTRKSDDVEISNYTGDYLEIKDLSFNVGGDIVNIKFENTRSIPPQATITVRAKGNGYVELKDLKDKSFGISIQYLKNDKSHTLYKRIDVPVKL